MVDEAPMTTLSTIVVAMLLAIAAPASADPGRTLRAGMHDDPPFAIHKGEDWSGISVELLRGIAAELGAKLEIRDVTREQIVQGALPDVDIVATLNVAEKMNARYDLTHAFYSTGLSIAVPQPKKEGALSMIVRILSHSKSIGVPGRNAKFTFNPSASHRRRKSSRFPASSDW